MTLTWPFVFALLAVTGTTAYVLGAAQVHKWQVEEIRWVVGRTGRLNTALRLLYDTLGYEYPAPDDDDRAPAPSWWQRMRERRRGGQLVVVPVVPEVAEEPEAPQETKPQVTLEEPEAAFTPDPNPPTQPIVIPNPDQQPATQPTHEVITPQAIADDAWQRRSAELLAEFEARKAELR